jgi:hypothetical protein
VAQQGRLSGWKSNHKRQAGNIALVDSLLYAGVQHLNEPVAA